jgi:membrane-associated protease RseP (regulator of RpoE activity)
MGFSSGTWSWWIGAGAAALLGGATFAADGAAVPDGGMAKVVVEKSGDRGAEQRRAQYWFGVAVENIPPTFARQLKLNRDQGLMVMAVLRDSPAASAGLKAEDLLIEIDGRPLASQEDLAGAANLMDDVEGKEGKLRAHTSRLTLLRDGDRLTVDLTPSLRPAALTVSGHGLESFVARGRAGESGDNKGVAVRNYVLPNGSRAEVGPGYRIDLNSNKGLALTDVSIKQIVSKGQTLILTQEQDLAGATHLSITVGGVKYPVEPGKIGSLPAELRPIGEQLLAEMPATRPAGTSNEVLDQRVKELEAKNQQLLQRMSDLQGEMAELIRLLREKPTK